MARTWVMCEYEGHEGRRTRLTRHDVRVVSIDVTDWGTNTRYARLNPTPFGLPRYVCRDCVTKMKERVREIPGQEALL